MVTDQTNSTNHASEQHYYHLFENLPICIFVNDLTTSPMTIVEVNRRTELIYGFSTAELIGMPTTKLVPEGAQESMLELTQHVRQGKTVSTETTSLHRDGTIFPVRIIAILDPTNKNHMIFTVESIVAEKELRNAALDADRLRIAYKTYDEAQYLAGSRFKTELGSHRAENKPNNLHTALDELQRILITAMEDMSRTIVTARVLSEVQVVVNPLVPPVEPLTKGEMAVLRLVARGVENEYIAKVLNYSVYTVANRLRTIYEKLHVTNRTQAVLYALRQGWVTLNEPLI